MAQAVAIANSAFSTRLHALFVVLMQHGFWSARQPHEHRPKSVMFSLGWHSAQATTNAADTLAKQQQPGNFRAGNMQSYKKSDFFSKNTHGKRKFHGLR